MQTALAPTGAGQAANQQVNMATLADGLEYFDRARDSPGASGQCRDVHASDFRRTLTTNGDGTDRGWGPHHMFMSGPVTLVGSEVIGEFPTIGLGHERDAGYGRLIP